MSKTRYTLEFHVKGKAQHFASFKDERPLLTNPEVMAMIIENNHMRNKWNEVIGGVIEDDGYMVIKRETLLLSISARIANRHLQELIENRRYYYTITKYDAYKQELATTTRYMNGLYHFGIFEKLNESDRLTFSKLETGESLVIRISEFDTTTNEYKYHSQVSTYVTE